MSDGVWVVCPSCGCLVSDADIHDKFHASIDALIAAAPAETDGA